MNIDPGRFDRRITFERRNAERDATYGTAVGGWQTVVTVWAEVRDVLPSRAESVDESISLQRRPCRIRMRYRDDISSDMQVDLGGRKLRIVGGPAEIGGRRQYLELVAEELSTAGNEP